MLLLLGSALIVWSSRLVAQWLALSALHLLLTMVGLGLAAVILVTGGRISAAPEDKNERPNRYRDHDEGGRLPPLSLTFAL